MQSMVFIQGGQFNRTNVHIGALKQTNDKLGREETGVKARLTLSAKGTLKVFDMEPWSVHSLFKGHAVEIAARVG